MFILFKIKYVNGQTLSINKVQRLNNNNKNDMKDSVVYFLHNEKGLTIVIRSYTDYNLIEFFKSGTSLIKFKDELMMNDNKLIRIIDNKKYYFENGEQFLLTSELKTKFISKTKKSKDLVNNFITIDIETYIVDG